MKGQFRVDAVSRGSSANLTDTQKETIARVLSFYGDKDAQWLSDLTHMEDPWKKAYAEGRSVVDVAEEETDLTREELERLMDPVKLAKPE